MVSTSSTQRTKGVDSARRALQILLQFSENAPELTVENILDAHDISLPSAYRYIALLREMNLIEERSKGSYVLSPQVIKLSRAAEQSFDYHGQVQPALDHLRDETGEAALFLRRLNDHAVCVAIAESDHAVRLSFQPGSLMPLHSGAAAKILLASYSKAKRTAYLNRVQPTLSTEDRVRLDKEFSEIRVTGTARSSGEVDEGVWAAAAAVRLHGKVVGAITVAAPGYRVDDATRDDMATAVVKAAHDLERGLASF